VQLYFDRAVTGVENLIFSSGTHISVYAELGQICHAAAQSPEPRVEGPESPSPDSGPWTRDSGLPRRGLVELVVAPAAEWFGLDDAEITGNVMREFTALHPRAASARLLKSTVVRIPQSVYQARPGVDRHRPGQVTSIPNFFLCGDYTRQDYLASMEGAVLSGKRVAARVREANLPAVGASRSPSLRSRVNSSTTSPAWEVAVGA
jgi:15-cis-phytoene desaturase